MLKAGCTRGATGENAILYNAGRADLILGPIGVILANGIMGEVSPAAAAARLRRPGGQDPHSLRHLRHPDRRRGGVPPGGLSEAGRGPGPAGGGALNRSFPALAGSTPPLSADGPQSLGSGLPERVRPRHMVSDPALALERLLTECRGLPRTASTARRSPSAAVCAASIWNPPTSRRRGSCPWCPFSSPPPPAGTPAPGRVWMRGWSPSSPWTSPGYPAWLRDYRAEDCPALHHSEAFRSAYHPHYRCWSGIM